ncbi:hypothetical protein JANAI62_00200 [Jannaschia pagri]|uniref:DUF4165 domain-containing protein n=1 Tax=Jannaschia pagri TaxID=2829797 RepID=A0ABQ4NG40_9RHOB|nr:MULTISPECIES: hypothetical protein [unclassified Jannaschia]GIT90498.1 hypothetical protein JANAI61_09560 [Jannaschia sp. AI_61]GIT93397.1 hypothetical protein JANAI62_00200 [Jannaschia sp. AI_62]
MKKIIALAAVAIAFAAPASAHLIRVIHPVDNAPVVLHGDKVISEVQPIDMTLTPYQGSQYAFTNAAGQVVIQVPASRTVTLGSN